MNYLSLFSGAGGGDLAMQHLLGFKCRGYVDYEPYCQKVIRQRIADGFLHAAPVFGDVREFISGGYAGAYTGMVDLIVAGFPCQPFSVAGKRGGEADERNMWPPTIEAVRIIRPHVVWLENVPGLLSPERKTLYEAVDEGRVYEAEEWASIRAAHEVQITLPSYFGRVLGDLAESGYDARWCVLGADDCGAPHRRKRVWILAYAKSFPRIEATWGQQEMWAEQLGRSGEVGKTLMENPVGNGSNPRWTERKGQQRRTASVGASDVADAEGITERSGLCPDEPGRIGRRRPGDDGSAAMGHALDYGLSDWVRSDGSGVEEDETYQGKALTGSGVFGWPVEPDVGRVAHGVAFRVDRLKAIGNGQVSRVAATAWRILTSDFNRA